MTVYIQVENRNVALPARVLIRVQPTRVLIHVQLAYQNARQYRVKPAMFYAGATNYVLQRSAGGRDSLGNLGYSSQVQCSLVHDSPTLSFSLLAVRRLQYGKQ